MFLPNIIIFRLCLLIVVILCWQSTVSFAQKKLEDVVILHPRTKDTLLIANQVIKEVKSDEIIVLKRPKNTYQMSFSFPYHNWKADFSLAEWNTRTDAIIFSNPDSLSGFCLSEAPMHRGLEISSVKARLAVVPRSLSLDGIAGIKVANGWVVPSPSKKITLSGQTIPTLQNATLLLNAFSKYHKITGCDIILESRFSYKVIGGIFNYQEPNSDAKVYLFKNFSHKSKVIKQSGNIGIMTEMMVDVAESDNFFLADGRQFQGKMKFIDSSPKPSYSGQVKSNNQTWIKYKTK